MELMNRDIGIENDSTLRARTWFLLVVVLQNRKDSEDARFDQVCGAKQKWVKPLDTDSNFLMA